MLRILGYICIYKLPNIKRIRKQDIPLELLHNEKTSLIGNGAQYLSLRLASASSLALSE